MFLAHLQKRCCNLQTSVWQHLSTGLHNTRTQNTHTHTEQEPERCMTEITQRFYRPSQKPRKAQERKRDKLITAHLVLLPPLLWLCFICMCGDLSLAPSMMSAVQTHTPLSSPLTTLSQNNPQSNICKRRADKDTNKSHRMQNTRTHNVNSYKANRGISVNALYNNIK